MRSDPVLARAKEAAHMLLDERPPWADVLGSALTLVGGDSACMMSWDRDDIIGMEGIQLDDAASRDYNAHFHKLDIGLPIAQQCAPGTWIDTQDVLGSREAQRSPYYVDFMCRHRMLQVTCYILGDPGGQRVGLSFQRSSVDSRARGRIEGTRIASYTAELGRILSLRRARAAQWATSANLAFDALGESLLLAGRSGTVFHTNACAGQWLAQQTGGIQLTRGKLSHRDPRVRAAIQQALSRACDAATPSVVRIPAQEGAQACVLDFAPAAVHPHPPGRTWLMVRLRRAPARRVDVESLRTVFDLTAAEARVLQALAAGAAPQQYAKASGVSIHTVRKQIAMLREKMDCVRQVDLVRKALQAGG